MVLATPFVLVFAFGDFGAGASVGAPLIVALSDSAAPKLVEAVDPERAETRKREAALRQDPKNVALASDVARRYIEDSRRNLDPRALGWAWAALAPWEGDANAPSEVLLLRATIRQSRHDFTQALIDLGTLLTREPNHVQASLTRATVLGVLGRPQEARPDCETLRRARAHPLVAAVCHAQLDSLTGKPEQGRERIDGVMGMVGDVPAALRSWALATRGELHLRTGDVAAAETDFRASLALVPNDGWTLAALADLMLDAGRPGEVLTLIGESQADNLLLRHALAHLASGQPHPPDEEQLRLRFAAAHAREDAQHLREEARFVLAFDGDAERALTLALENWQHQREPADARVALEAAVAAKAPGKVADIVAHVRATGLRDVAIDKLITTLGAP